MKKSTKRLLWFSPLILLLILTLAIVTLLGTNLGAGWILSIGKSVAAGKLSYDGTEGSLTGPFELRGMSYRDGDMQISVDNINLDWDWAALMSAEAKVNKLLLDGITIRLPAADAQAPPPSEPLQLPDITLPVKVDIESLVVANIRVFPYGVDEPLIIDRLALSLSVDDNGIAIKPFDANALGAEASLSGSVNPSGNYPLDLSLTWRTVLPDLGEIAGEGKISGNIDDINIDYRIGGLANATITGNIRDLLKKPVWKVDLNLDRLDIARFDAQLEGDPLSGMLSATGVVDEFEAQAKFNTRLDSIGAVETGFDASGNASKINLAELSIKSPETTLDLDMAGFVGLDPLNLDIKGQWRDLAWPPGDNPQVLSRNGQFTAVGDAERYQIKLETDAESPEFGIWQALVQASGSLETLLIEQIELKHPSSARRFAASGTVGIEQQSFDLKGGWEDMAWPLIGQAQIDSPEGEFTAKGTAQQYEAILVAQLASDDFGNVKANISANGTDKEVRLPTLNLASDDGELSLDITGRFGFEQQDFEADGTWQNLAWPLIGEAQYTSPKGKLSASGKPDDFVFDVQTGVQGAEIGSLDIVANGSGSTSDIHLPMLDISSPDKTLNIALKADVNLDGPAFDVNGSWKGLRWPLVGEAQVDSPSGKLTAVGDMNDYKADLDALLTSTDTGDINATIRAIGNAKTVKISSLKLQSTDGKLSFDTRADVQIDPLQFDANGGWKGLRWPLTGKPQIESPNGSFTANGNLDAYAAKLDALFTSADTGDVNATIRATGNADAVKVSALNLQSADGNLTLDTRANVQFDPLQFDANGNWKGLRWPLTGEAEFGSDLGDFNASGSPEDYVFDLNAGVNGAAIPTSQWSIKGAGSDTGVRDTLIHSDLLTGTLDANVNANWAPEVNWEATLKAAGINPAEMVAEWPGSIDLSATSKGRIGDSGVEARVDIDPLGGTLNARALGGKFGIDVSGESFAISDADVTLGNTKIDVGGGLADEWNLDFNVDIADLSQYKVGGSGALGVRGRLTGPKNEPKATFELRGDNLALDGNSAKSLSAKGKLDMNSTQPSAVNLNASGVNATGQVINDISLNAEGTISEHTISAKIDGGELVNLDLGARGGLDSDVWSGLLQRLTVDNAIAGKWALDQPAALSAGAEKASLDQACLSSDPTRLCLQGSWSAASGSKADFNLEELALNRFQSGLPEGSAISGNVSGKGTATMTANGDLDADVQVDLSASTIALETGGEQVRLEVRGGSLNARSDGRSASADLKLDMGDMGDLSADVKLGALGGNPTIDGSVKLAIRSLDIIAAVVGEIQTFTGQVNADLNLSGPLSAPVIRGEAQLADAGVVVPLLGLEISNLTMAARSDGSGPLVISGGATSGGGDLTFSGDILASGDGAKMTIKGENFQLANSSEIKAKISPDINIEFGESKLSVTGELLIPSALITPPDVSSGVGASGDVVIVNRGDGEQVAPAQSLLKVSAQVRVILGDDVNVQAAGFNGKLLGNLLVKQQPNLPPTGSGQMEIEAGEYKIYGQFLNIEKGRVLFTGGPLDNPGLNIRAARTIKDGKKEVEVGATITGTAQAPKLNLFSSPSLSDSSIISYLIFGNSGSGDADVGSLLGSNLLQSGSAGVGSAVTDATGLDEVGVGSDGLSAGKYLSPDLFVSVGMGVFEQVTTFLLRYKINDMLSVEATSGIGTAVDLIYTLER